MERLEVRCQKCGRTSSCNGREAAELVAAIKRGRLVPCRLRDFSTKHDFCGGRLEVLREVVDSSHLSDVAALQQATTNLPCE